ncbi:hypothetical protein BU15DRAFT_80250 [Melanogaster broomeanus]|nr:hypothetical protein BU15DRAFT_80250 [Melanogaster broomeanus]
MVEPPHPATSTPHPHPRRLSWLQRYSHHRDSISSPLDAVLPPPQEGHVAEFSACPSGSSTPRAEPRPRTSSRPSTPRRLSTASLSLLFSFPSSSGSAHSPVSHDIPQVDQPPSPDNGGSSQQQPSTSALPSATPAPVAKPELSSRMSGSFGKMFGGLSSLGLSRSSTPNDDKDKDKDKEARGRSSSTAKPRSSSIRTRTLAVALQPAPFPLSRRLACASPSRGVLTASPSPPGARSSSAHAPPSQMIQTQGSECAGEDTEEEDDEWSDDTAGMFDILTERNTEQNAQIAVVGSDGLLIGEIDGDGDGDASMDPDPLGEGVNVVVPPEPYFPSTLNRSSFSSMRGKRGGVKEEEVKAPRGDASFYLETVRTYVVASDLSDESRYAVEWGIGTVLRDGDEMLIVTVVENEKQSAKGLAYILVRQATALLQRTRLHVTVSCQAWHAKNARHMLLDIVDYNEPTMLIVGSRGLGQLKGILLGSTSHYLIQRCSVPVMVARRRLKRPAKRSAHLAKHRVHVSLAEAGIDRVAAKVDQDVAVMRDEMQREDERRGEKGAAAQAIEEEGEAEAEGEDGAEEGEEGSRERAERLGDGAEGEGFLGTKVRG